MLDKIKLQRFVTQDIRSDFFASMVVFVVALPLCLGIAVASGAPAISGIIGGVIGGLFVGLFGGSPFQVSGPANGLIVVSWEFIANHGFGLFMWAVLFGGVLQIFAGVLRVGQMFRAVTPAVICGLMTGFAVVIASGQFHVLLGGDPQGDTFTNLAALYTQAQSVLSEGSHQDAMIIGSISLFLLFFWKKLPLGVLRKIPAPLATVVIATGVSMVFAMSAPQISLPASLFEGFQLIQLKNWSSLLHPEVMKAGFLIAFIASAETLLCATAVDRLHQGPRTRYNRELTAQGIGNSLCGLVGAIPITGVIIRSSANVAAGAKSRASTVFHGLWLVLFVVLFPGLLAKIPMACLAAVLIHAVVRLVKLADLKEIYSHDQFGIVVYVVTAAAIVVFDVFTGVAAGLVLSAAKLLYTLSALKVSVESIEQNKYRVTLKGSASFIRIPTLSSELEKIPSGAKVQLDVTGLCHLDHACHSVLSDWERMHKMTGGEVSPDVASFAHDYDAETVHVPAKSTLRESIRTESLGPKRFKTTSARVTSREIAV